MNTIFSDKVFYHIYPLGLCNCPKHNDFSSPAGNAFEVLTEQLDYLADLGINALYIGPIFESTSHGYDTLDYFYVDRRLGNNQKFKEFCRQCHNRGISVILDAVFNHTGRDFFAFKDIIIRGQTSPYKDWYLNLRFDQRSCYGDNFNYDGWAGCMDLVKLNVENPAVQEHLFAAVKSWIDEFNIDGLRLDAADVLAPSFMDKLSAYTKSLKPDFWLMGEVVHGDYNNWVRPGRLDSVTNYQIYKALWSSLNDKNLFELSYNLNREFGNGGMYNYSLLYNFVDNHDVNRIASTINNHSLLTILYGLLFTIPGIPSIYYGSEMGLMGQRGAYDDFQLRPPLPPFVSEIPEFARPWVDRIQLSQKIKTLSTIHRNEKALQIGQYQEVLVTNQQFAFQRFWENQRIVVAINAADEVSNLRLNVEAGNYTDLLTGEVFNISGNSTLPVNPKAIRILKIQR